MTMNNDDRLIFTDDPSPAENSVNGPEDFWKVLIVDDDMGVHSVTKFVLADLVFEGKKIQFFSVYNGREAIKFLNENIDIAVVLLDVVMETEDDGLLVVKYIRDVLQNPNLRIILRTGQPGSAPEKKVIIEYDINDYKEKTELTAQKLYTSVVTALRSYRDLLLIDDDKKGLKYIVDSISEIFRCQTMKKSMQTVLIQFRNLLEKARCIQGNSNGFAGMKEGDDFYILAALGEFEGFIDRKVTQVMPDDVKRLLTEADLSKESIIRDNTYLIYFAGEEDKETILYLDHVSNLSENSKYLIEIFCNNVKIAMENSYLQHEIEETQKDIICTLGELVDTSPERAGHHTKRVAEYVGFLAEQMGFEAETVEILKMAAPMHDVGKLGILDAICYKAGPLTTEEFEIMKTHAVIGYNVFKNSKRKILKVAAILAHQHHEKYDGTGYPRGLSGENIHIYARIMAAADVFDALGSDRVYRLAWSLEEIVKYFKEQKGRHFDPEIVDVVIQNLPQMLAIGRKYQDL